MGLKDEFYLLFEGYSKDEINHALYLLNCVNEITNVWGLDSHVECKEEYMSFIFLIKLTLENGDIYKKVIWKSFLGYKKDDVLVAFTFLSEEYANSMKKIYVLVDMKMFSQRVDERDIQNINYGIKYINDYLVNNCKKNDFFSLFQQDGENYTVSEILLVFDILSEDKKEIAYKKYGISLLECANNSVLTAREKDIMDYSVVRHMKRHLKKLREGYGIYSVTDEFPGKTLLEIKALVDALDEKGKNYYYNLFEKDLKRKKQSREKGKVTIITKEYKRKVELKMIGAKKRDLKDFFSRFMYLKDKSISEEDFKIKIIKVINSELNSYCKDILVRAFGTNYDEVHLKNITDKERKYLSVYIIPRIKHFLLKEAGLQEILFKFYERIPCIFSLNEIEEVMSLLLDEKELVLIEKVEKFLRGNESVIVSSLEMNKFYLFLNRVISMLISNKSEILDINKRTLGEICSLMKSKDYENLESLYGGNVAIAVLISVHFTNVSNQAIELLTGVNSETLLKYREDYLKNYNNNVRKYINTGG